MGRQTVPRAELQAFFVLPPNGQRPCHVHLWRHGRLQKNFGACGRGSAVCRVPTKITGVPSVNLPNSVILRSAGWPAHEESQINRVDATMAWFIGLNTLADGVAEAAAEFCEFLRPCPLLPHGSRVRVGLPAIAQLSRHLTRSKRTLLHHCLLRRA